MSYFAEYVSMHTLSLGKAAQITVKLQGADGFVSSLFAALLSPLQILLAHTGLAMVFPSHLPW